MLFQIAITLASLCVSAAHADASCTIALDGDARARAQIGAELALFGDDDSPCVELRASCGWAGDQLVVELRDVLGGGAQRMFGSAAGAAAFLISWSRRPISSRAPVSETAAAPPAPPPRPPSATAVTTAAVAVPAAPRPHGWDVEVGVAGLAGFAAYLGALTAAVLKYEDDQHIGVALRAMTASTDWNYQGDGGHRAYVGTQLEGVLGRDGPITRWLRWRAHVAGGASAITKVTVTDDLRLAELGLHGAIRAALAWSLRAGVNLDLSAGFEVVWQSPLRRDHSPLGEDEVKRFAHAEIGLRWTL